MNSITKKVTIGLAALAATVGMAAPSTVAAASPTVVSAGGTGTVTARGTGAAQLSGDIDGMVVDGQGVLVIVDRAGDAKVAVRGAGRSTVHGNTRTYVGFNGHARISGSNVTVRVVGVDVRLAAKGDGTFVLKGTGRYDTTPGMAGGNGIWGRTGTHGDL
jgi:hypothetical protein